MKEDAKRREQNNPMKVCVLKYDHFENIHRLDAKLPSYEGAPNFRQVAYALSAWIPRINNYDNVELLGARLSGLRYWPANQNWF